MSLQLLTNLQLKVFQVLQVSWQIFKKFNLFYGHQRHWGISIHEEKKQSSNNFLYYPFKHFSVPILNIMKNMHDMTKSLKSLRRQFYISLWLELNLYKYVANIFNQHKYIYAATRAVLV